jgi:hypothetical protein
VAGEDRFELTASGFSLVRRAGPFHLTRRFDRSAVRRLRVRGRDKMLVAGTARGVEVRPTSTFPKTSSLDCVRSDDEKGRGRRPRGSGTPTVVV